MRALAGGHFLCLDQPAELTRLVLELCLDRCAPVGAVREARRSGH